ncbi:hypothetical protein F511_31837 [Dorcoceras hygrometricum]|uniref:GRPD C-terminal domain-containing protein n=1 Tax=Dorcoceras hygrometricum TaxID=472368 RepID=A0A2Z7ACL1_9LAMI|nr:hypothetical protein F511_31837 [Dorcoceras hygrometricum]
MSAVEAISAMRSFSEIPEDETVSPSVDLVAAATRNLVFLRILAESQWLHHKPTILEAIRRYDQLWMPLIADLSKGLTKPPMILPPLDVEWIWFCHSLSPANYRCYCEARFSKIIGKPTIFYEENEEYALDRCRKIWEDRFPSEPFENEVDPSLENCSVVSDEGLLEQALKMRYLCRLFYDLAWSYNSELVFLIAANKRYKGFIYMIHKYADEHSCLVPTSDVLLMWLTHKSYPTVYAVDIKELELDAEKIVMESDKEEDIEKTKSLWERTFDQPYERAGSAVIAGSIVNESPVYLDVTHSDVNTSYESMVPRFLLEVCISVKTNSSMKNTQRDFSRDFLRFRMAKCHWELKIDKPMSNFNSQSWRKALHLYCEFGTKEMILELRNHGGLFSKGSTLQRKIPFPWNDLIRAPSLTIGKEVIQGLKAMASITPPVQASYLLKFVPDRVTDDSGAMISDVILRMNHYRPQEGRWLSRTVLDHATRECFVARMRVGGGFWRRGGEAPKAVKPGDRIIEIRGGSWSYVTGSSSIGRAPEKVVGTASPKEPLEGYKASWSFSTGDELNIMWDATSSISSMSFNLHHRNPTESRVKLLKGRQMQYHVNKSWSEAREQKQDKKQGTVKDDRNFEEEYFVTVVRFSEGNPIGKATGLLNWKLQMVEFLPEEDAVLVLLLCLSILRSVSVMKREDVGNLLVRSRVREAKAGERDWGSVILHPSSYSPNVSSPYLHPWYWNASLFVPSKDQMVSPPSLSYSQAEGGDDLYKSWIIS